MFVDNVNEFISNISKENKLCYLMGNVFQNVFPINYKTHKNNSHSATLIDYIFTNNTDNLFICGLLMNDAFDHLPIFSMSVVGCDNTVNKSEWLIYREKSPSNIAKFKDELSKVN